MDQDTGRKRYTPLDVAAIVDGSQIIFDDGRYRVVSLKAAPAAAWWGRGTRWCTTNSGCFQTYEKQGELVCIEDRRSLMRWQFQFWRCELRNWRNRRTDPHVFAQKHPIVIDALRTRIDHDFRARFFFGLASDNERIDHSLNLRGVRLKALPRGLRIRDDLDVCDTGIRELPEGLCVGGDLYVSEFPLPAIPRDIRIRGIRYIRSKRLWHLREMGDP